MFCVGFATRAKENLSGGSIFRDWCPDAIKLQKVPKKPGKFNASLGINLETTGVPWKSIPTIPNIDWSTQDFWS